MTRTPIEFSKLVEAMEAAEAASEAAAEAVDKLAAVAPNTRPQRGRRAVLIRMSEGSAIALAKQAAAEGVTQKQLICRALAAAGVPMDPLDLEDRTPRRRAAA